MTTLEVVSIIVGLVLAVYSTTLISAGAARERMFVAIALFVVGVLLLLYGFRLID